MIDNMPIKDEWLSQILGAGTKRHYTRGLTYFMQFLNVSSAEQLINLRKKEERNFETRIIQFYQWLQNERKVTSNSARAYIIALQSFFTYVGFPVRLKNKLPKLHMRLEIWHPSKPELQRIYKYGDLAVKCWMSLSRDCPARMSDMLTITTEQIASGEFLLQSKKEGVTGKVYVSSETQTLFQQLKNAGLTLPGTQRGVDLMMENACRIAGIPKRLNQHLLRKLWISTARNLGLNEVVVKILSFKAVPIEDLTYQLDREDLRDTWKKVIDALPLESAGNGNGRLADLQKKNEEFETMMRILARYVLEAMKDDSRNRKYKQPPSRIQDRRALEDYVEKTSQ